MEELNNGVSVSEDESTELIENAPEADIVEETQNKKSPKNIKKWILIGVIALICAGVVAWCVYSAVVGNGIGDVIGFSTVVALLFGIFLVSALGYLLGRITIKGVNLGTAGVFLVAIAFGCLCTIDGLGDLPIIGNLYISGSSSPMYKYYGSIVQNVGLVLFVASVGFIAGPNFFKNLKKNAKTFVILGAVIIVTGAVLAILFTLCMKGSLGDIAKEFSVGVLAGSLTTTPGYSAALEASATEMGKLMITLGYAVAYPFGVIGVVLFVQLLPKFLKADMEKERALLKIGGGEARVKKEGLFVADDFGLMPFALAVVAGLILGSIKIPLSGDGYEGTCFSLGTTGGVLIMCLIFGHFGHMGKLSLEIPEETAKVFREFGLMMFLIGAGVSGGAQLIAQINEHGGLIILYGFLAGIVMNLVPMIAGFFMAKYVLKMSLLNNLGSITGGMTSTPALGTLISTAGTDDVASAYASTYPVALVLIVLASQLIVTLM